MSDVMMQSWVAVQTWLSATKDAMIGDEEGQGMVEYSLILGLVAVIAIVILVTMGGQINNIFQNISAQLALSPAN
jgi:pilus assembly protein Flp/PilA